MASTFGQIRPQFDQLRRFVLNDLRRITRQCEGGNFAAIAVIGSACEALGGLRYKKKDGGSDFFTEYLLPCEWKEVGPDLWDALRNGIAHGYETKIIKVQGCEIVVAVSWREKEHLTFSEDRSMLFVNVRALEAALRRAINRYEAELKRDANLRDDFLVMWERDRSKDVQNKNHGAAWHRLLSR